MSDIVVVHGPTVDAPCSMMYQVTLASGIIVTNPGGFGEPEAEYEEFVPIVSEDGRVLTLEPHTTT